MDSAKTQEKPRHALVAVFDPALRRLCNETLTSVGFAPAPDLDSGIAAVAAARDVVPEVILLSQQLADVPADEAVKWLRSNPALTETPIIVLGGKGKSADCGPHDLTTVVSRPFTSDYIRYALLEALTNKRSVPRLAMR